jgi:hypothetical protein
VWRRHLTALTNQAAGTCNEASQVEATAPHAPIIKSAFFNGIDLKLPLLFRPITAPFCTHVGRTLPPITTAHFGWLGMFVGADMPASSALTRERLGWRPTGPGLISDLDQMRYFEI